MEIYGADISGIEGQLIRFKAVKEENRPGTTLLGLAQKVVREGYLRAVKAIESLRGEWDVVSNQGYTIDLHPAETPKTSSGLDLPLAIMLLQASILQNEENLKTLIDELQEKLTKLGDKSTKSKNKSTTDTKKEKILNNLNILIKQKELILKYKKRIQDNKNKYLLIGTLDIIDGKIESPLRGMFGMISATRNNFKVIIPEDAEIQAAVISRSKKNCNFFKASNLQEVWNILLGISSPRKVRYNKSKVEIKKVNRYVPNLNAIEGVSKAKYAMTIALAGGHNILLVGPPGQGKTMLSMAAVKLLPTIKTDEMFEINKIYSAKGVLKGNEVVLSRPFQEANDNVTEAGLFGGGHTNLVPGLISLAHRGILYFDEINQCTGKLIEKLRTPLNNKIYTIARVTQAVDFPCNFILAAAMNPCKCGWYNHYYCPECKSIFFQYNRCEKHPSTEPLPKCTCSIHTIEQHKHKLSRPLLDRIDLKVFVSAFDINESYRFDYATRTVRSKIERAREKQQERYRAKYSINCNGDVPDKSQMEDVNESIIEYLSKISRKLNIDTKRTEVKSLLVARTIADIEASNKIKKDHLDQAIDLMGITDHYFRDL